MKLRPESETMSPKHTIFIIIMIVCSTQTLGGEVTTGRPVESVLYTPRGGCTENRELRQVDCYDQDLVSVPQDLPEDIKGLSLQSNYIPSLLNSSFVGYPFITELDLSINWIIVIDPTTFHPLKDLKYLDMSLNRNPITPIAIALPSPGLFRWATKLSYLIVSSTLLRTIPNDTFKWSRNLDTLDLHAAYLKSIHISVCGVVRHVDLSLNEFENLTAEAFNFGCHIKTLSLANNPIKSVDPDVIASLDVRSLVLGGDAYDLLSLDVLRDIFIGISRSMLSAFSYRGTYSTATGNSLVIPRDLFNPLRDYPLKMLDLSSNGLKSLYPFVFSNLTKLRQLNLSENRVITLEPNFFEGMRELRILDLNLNRIKYINTYNISWTIDLIELHLPRNLLTAIDESTFRGFHTLTLLNISSNGYLSEVHLTSFKDLKSIRILDLSFCDIEEFDVILPNMTSLFLNHNPPLYLNRYQTFFNLRSLEHLGLRESHIWFFKLYDYFTNVSYFDGLSNLKTLDLSRNNNIHGQYLIPGVFHQLSAVESLLLEACSLSIMYPLTFIGLHSLKVLVLRSNQLHPLHKDLFKELYQLTDIDLAENGLVHLDKTLFTNNQKLTTLSLSGNGLTRLDPNTFGPIYSSLSSIDLSRNHIVCNCDISWLLDWLHGSLRLLPKGDTNCALASLAHLRDKPLLDFDPKEFCGTNVTLVCLVSFAVIALILIIAIGYHNRWQLRYKIFLVKLAAIGYKEIRDARDHNDYEFDLNVIFYDDDEEWIREQLRPALAERLPQFQRNVFGDNDLVLGMHYLDSVDYVVTHSYKTVVVLSTAAVRDRWFILKFRTAMDHVSDTQTEFVVVVFLEDIPDEEIPFLARLYLSDGRPYVYWPDDVRGHEYFFDELTKRLTINLRTNDLIPNE